MRCGPCANCRRGSPQGHRGHSQPSYDPALSSTETIAMHAWLCENPVGVEALQWKELPTPVPKAGEVLIAIQAASLNFPDLLIVQNKYQHKPPLPFVPGSEYAGVIEAVGEGVKHLQVGQSVACLSGTGGFGPPPIAPPGPCLPLPPRLSPPGRAAVLLV